MHSLRNKYERRDFYMRETIFVVFNLFRFVGKLVEIRYPIVLVR